MSTCAGCYNKDLPCSRKKCPSNYDAYKHLVGAWKLKDRNARFEGEYGWTKLQCKNKCGLWGYARGEVFELSGPNRPFHGPNCGKPQEEQQQPEKKKKKQIS